MRSVGFDTRKPRPEGRTTPSSKSKLKPTELALDEGIVVMKGKRVVGRQLEAWVHWHDKLVPPATARLRDRWLCNWLGTQSEDHC